MNVELPYGNVYVVKVPNIVQKYNWQKLRRQEKAGLIRHFDHIAENALLVGKSE
jgi:hypothetical protein